LPEENYSDRAAPDPREEAAAEEVMSRCARVDELLSELGPPDSENPWVNSGFEAYYDLLVERYPDELAPAKRWLRCLRYSKRWPSLYLDVYEYDGGAIEHLIWGQSND